MARASAEKVIRETLPEWADEQVAELVEILIKRGFASPGTGYTYRVIGNDIRKVVPDTKYARVKVVTIALQAATDAITRSDAYDKLPHLCTHCGKRYATYVSPRTHMSNCKTILDPRTF